MADTFTPDEDAAPEPSPIASGVGLPLLVDALLRSLEGWTNELARFMPHTAEAMASDVADLRHALEHDAQRREGSA